jgi:hypothetical protein
MGRGAWCAVRPKSGLSATVSGRRRRFEDARVMRTFGLHWDRLEGRPSSASNLLKMWYGVWYGLGEKGNYYLLTAGYSIIRRTLPPPFLYLK